MAFLLFPLSYLLLQVFEFAVRLAGARRTVTLLLDNRLIRATDRSDSSNDAQHHKRYDDD